MPQPQLLGCDSTQEAVAYSKKMIIDGLDPDTQAPAGMTHTVGCSPKFKNSRKFKNITYVQYSGIIDALI